MFKLLDISSQCMMLDVKHFPTSIFDSTITFQWKLLCIKILRLCDGIIEPIFFHTNAADFDSVFIICLRHFILYFFRKGMKRSFRKILKMVFFLVHFEYGWLNQNIVLFLFLSFSFLDIIHSWWYIMQVICKYTFQQYIFVNYDRLFKNDFVLIFLKYYFLYQFQQCIFVNYDRLFKNAFVLIFLKY